MGRSERAGAAYRAIMIRPWEVGSRTRSPRTGRSGRVCRAGRASRQRWRRAGSARTLRPPTAALVASLAQPREIRIAALCGGVLAGRVGDRIRRGVALDDVVVIVGVQAAEQGLEGDV